MSGKLTRDSSCSGQQSINVPVVTAAATTFDVEGTNGRLRMYSSLDVLGSYPTAFTKSGSGELDFYGANTWTGVAEVTGGRLVLANAASIPANTDVQVVADGLGTAELNLATPMNISLVYLEGQSSLTGASSNTLTTTWLGMNTKSLLSARVVGTSQLYVYGGATATITQYQGYTGSLTLAGTLTSTVGEGAMGELSSKTIFYDGSRLVLFNGSTISAGRSLNVASGTAEIDGLSELDGNLSGAGRFNLYQSTSTNVALGGSSASFTGILARDAGGIVAAKAGSLGNASWIILDGYGGVLDIQAANASLTKPNLTLGAQGHLKPHGNNPSFNTLEVGGNQVYIDLDNTAGQVNFESISLTPLPPGSLSAPLTITNWSGGTHVFVNADNKGVTPSNLVLSQIQFQGFPIGAVILGGGELFPAEE